MFVIVPVRIIGVVAAVFHGIAISLTVLRLSYRGYIRRFWWEDVWASLGLVFSILCLLSIWLQIWSGSDAIATTNIACNWMLAITFTSVVWSARLSILCSVIRVVNPDQTYRRFAFGVALSFGAMWIAIIVQKMYICYHYYCDMGREVAISQLITDIVSDTLLVGLPLRLLQGVKLSRNRRILVCCAFSASFLITAATILHSLLIFFVGSISPGTIIVAHGKAAVSLIVCNTLVVATLSYRIFRRSGGHDLDESCPSETIHFTTIDLTQLTNSRVIAPTTEANPTSISAFQTQEHLSDSKSVRSDSDGYRQCDQDS
ncbi:hypothetical protein BJ138DRAFT_1141409 [Hygrophoropsis aurantiaca]|uniref:Uncharacterized protein n=1 Tax=Hygrophoropsis aurantiaca TaxID=72124 RepID=A0ACB8AQU2_9AGAM|nr:hypothetical protein BJ138DRAFT_1141409 [Hygrophoropsis aurantiaca]